MPVVATDLLAPTGPIDPSLFPGVASNVLSERLGVYIANAEQEGAVLVADASRQDAMVRAHAIWQAFTAVYIRMSTQPVTLAVHEKGSHTYSTEQIRNIRELAAQYRAEFDSLIVVPGTVRPGMTPGTMSVATDVQW